MCNKMALLNHLKHKIPAATIIEVVVAMLIAAICFSLAFATLGQLTVYSLSKKQQTAERMLQNLMQESLAQENYFSEQREEGEWQLLKTVKAYGPELIEIEIAAIDPAGNRVSETKRLVYVSE